jgi:hypothetical protein
MKDNNKQESKVQEEHQNNDDSPATSQLESKKRGVGMKLRTNVKAGARVNCIGDGTDILQD